MRPEYFLVGGGWVAWCFFHSFLAARGVERALKTMLGERGGWYRLLYNLFAIISIIPVVTLEKTRATGLVVDWGGLEVLRLFFFWGAAAALAWIVLSYDLGDLAGIRSLGDADKAMYESLVTSGPLSVVRHPLYSLAFILLWTRPLSDTAIVSSVILTLYLLAGTWLEERKLTARFGDRYQAYKKTTPAYFPWGWFWRS